VASQSSKNAKSGAAPPEKPRSPLSSRASLVIILALGLGAFAIVFGLTKLQQKAASPTDTSPVTTHHSPAGMVWIPGGTFWRGNDNPKMPDAQPIHQVAVDGFWMDQTAVTNEQFARFVEATGYVTIAERTPDAKDFPGAPPESLVAGSVVFSPPSGPVPLDNHLRWWSYVKGANWRHPEGPQSNLQGREKHPVLQVAWDDAVAYARWAGKRLPTEAEFEFAARGGLDRKKFAWGDDLQPDGKWMANIWQGRFPYDNTAEDGYRATAPVGSFPANGYGLYDMAGNVWEWCNDWYRHDYYRTLAAGRQPVRNPQGPADSYDPSEPGTAKRVMRGGSYLCTDQYCTAYEAGARGKGAPDSGTNHLGFRCVKSPADGEKMGIKAWPCWTKGQYPSGVRCRSLFIPVRLGSARE
jgi:sulfatase modifying factor 1